MIKKEDFKSVLTSLGFLAQGDSYSKAIGEATLTVNFDKQTLVYPEKSGLKINERQVCNFAANENFVVFECVHRLLEKGYKPEHLELEPKWRVGHGASGGRADILVKDQQSKPLLLIECKTAGAEFDKEWKKMQGDGGQLFSYAQQTQKTQFLCLYAANFADKKVSISQKIISHKDNPQILEQTSKSLSFANANDVKERFAVWRDVYNKEYTETGIFESTVPAYQIGKSKYTLKHDTNEVQIADTQGKYHQFRTILRKHNIARRENAFEVLVNLFLCKIVDEEENKNNLKFRWKGIAYDNKFDFVDRLQSLYQRGMYKFLNEEISYISNEQIDSAFWTIKNNRNATKKQIQDYFRELKFFTNSAFSFIDTHNETLFDRNTSVLIEIVQMWQGLRLKTDQQNQFLGDMFENFLDNSIKQSNGQFFTPLPICKFIVSSLPLAQKIAATTEPLKVIDYACGSGHFLTEYAYQIKSLSKNERLAEHYQNIIGIEKEDRLAKVAKVSAHIHGYGQINIIDADALANHSELAQQSFDVLVANPPFAVEGFLQTLAEADKQQYELVKATGNNSNTNAIQCFFLERIHHLMAPGGVVGVIVPTSILSNTDTVHIGTRELLLQYFNFVSIAELGSGTFGKTGTQTVVLFLTRKTQKPEPAEHYKNRVDDFFEGDTKANVEAYQDHELVIDYCRHVGIAYEHYQQLFKTKSLADSDKLWQYDIFKEYKNTFLQSTKIKNLKESKNFTKKTTPEQQAELDKCLIDFIQTKELDKLYYFILANQQLGKVLVITAPHGNREQKQFLGYEWGTRKGSEGIKYNGGETVNNIITPLFDPQDLSNSKKINTAIQNNFDYKITAPLPAHCHYKNLTDMLDFSRVEFDKTISLNTQEESKINSQWEVKKLEEIISTIESGSRPKGGVAYLQSNVLSLGGEHIHANSGNIDLSNPKFIPDEFYDENKKGILKENDILLCKDGALTGKIALLRKELNDKKAMINEHVFILRCTPETMQKYIFNFLFSKNGQSLLKQNITGSAQGGLNLTNLKQIKVPIPPLKTQKKITQECEAVDEKVSTAQETIDSGKNQIAELVQKMIASNYIEKKLGEVINTIESGSRPKGGVSSIKSNIFSLGGEHIHKNNGGIDLSNPKFIPENFYNKSKKGILKENDILLCKDGALTGKIAFLREELNDKKAMINEHVFILRCTPETTQKYIFNFLFSKNGQLLLKQNITGSAQGGLNLTNLKQIKIPVPPLEIQKNIVDKINIIEKRIEKSQAIIDSSKEKKNAILESYL